MSRTLPQHGMKDAAFQSFDQISKHLFGESGFKIQNMQADDS